MAEDFYKAFALGTGDTSIGVQDLAGVNLAAVKALEARTFELQQKTAEIDALNARLVAMEQRLVALEQSMKTNTANATTADKLNR
jgi:tetrahydromethanopterin S-methyltransferase subunit C